MGWRELGWAGPVATSHLGREVWWAASGTAAGAWGDKLAGAGRSRQEACFCCRPAPLSFCFLVLDGDHGMVIIIRDC